MIPAQRGGWRGRCLRAGPSCALLLLVWAAAADAAEASAIETLADRIAQTAAAQKPDAPVAIQVLAASPELARAFGTVLAGKLAQRKLAPIVLDAPQASAAETEARTAGARSLLRVTVSLDSNRLHARGDLLGTWVNFWSGAAPTRPPSPAAALEASAEADAPALALASVRAPPRSDPALPQAELRLAGAVFARLARWTAALAAGDLDGDGRDEVVALTDEELLALSPDGRVLARRALRALPFSPSPSREPFGAACVDEASRRVAYLSAQRTRGETLVLESGGAGFRVVGKLEQAPLAHVAGAQLTGTIVPGQNTFEPSVASSAPASRWTAPAAFNALSAFAGPSGVELLVILPSGNAHWRRGLEPDAPSLELRGLGAASALADLDGDGAAEIATTEPVWAPAPEVLRVLRAPSASAPAPSGDGVRFRAELDRGRALQIAAADLDGDRAQELIVALWLPDGAAELRVFRRAP